MDYTLTITSALTLPIVVDQHHLEFRLMPATAAHQSPHGFALELTPAAHSHFAYIDGLGNQVHASSVFAEHEHLIARATCTVSSTLDNPFEFAAIAANREVAWLDDALRAKPRLFQFLLHRSALTEAPPSFPAPGPVGSTSSMVLVRQAMAEVAERVEHVATTTGAPRDLEAVLASGNASTEEMSHLLIALVRAIGLPARFVRGALDPRCRHPDDPDEIVRAPHAWMEALIPGAGWRGFDPSYQVVVDRHYLSLGIGREASDTRPVRSWCPGNRAGQGLTTEIELEAV